MNSIAFPNMFNKITTNVVSDYDATSQNLKLLFLSSKGELFGDPYYGTSLKKLFFDQNDVVLQDIVIDDLYSAICMFIPQIKIDRKDISIESKNKSELTIKIKAMNRESFTTNLYNIVLTEADV